MSPWVPRLVLAIVGAGIVAAIVSISVGEGGPGPITIEDADEVLTFYAALPQDEARLGPEDAPVEIDVFTDIRSTQGAEFHESVVRPLISEYVRDERARIELLHRSLGASDTSLAAIAATIAGEQGRQWQYADLVLRNLERAEERPEDVDAEFLGEVADTLRGSTRDFETDDWRSAFTACVDADDATPCAAQDVVRSADDRARELGIPAQTAIIVTGPGGSERLIDAPSLDEVRAAIERVAVTG